VAERPDDTNVIIGQAHFIKTAEDLHDGSPPAGVETDADVATRHALLRELGYKL
jgi:uncharacterized protein